MPRHHADFQGFQDGPRPFSNRGHGPLPVHPVALEEEIEIQHRENQMIIADNRHLLDENVILQRDLVAAKDEIHRLGQLIMKLRADQEAQTRDLFERGLKLEADLRATEPLRGEVIRLRAEAQKLNVLRQDLTVQIQGLTQDITRLRSENKQLSTLKVDVDGIRKQLAQTRRALEYEKKINEEQVKQKQTMEKNLMSMAREVEKLRAEQLSIDRRAHGLGSGGGGPYGMYNGNPGMIRYPGGGGGGGGAYGDGHVGTWSPYDNRGPPRS